MELQTISASKIKTFKTCNRQYYYRYVLPYDDRPDEDKNVAALLGTSLHRAIELRYKNGTSPIYTFQETMQNTLEQWEEAKRTINALGYFNRAMVVGKQILKDFDWNRYNPTELEYAFTLPFPNAEKPLVNITGLIDMITADGYVIDHKSATSAPSQVDLDNDIQFIIYAWAFKQIKGYSATRVIWNHLRTAKELDFDQTNMEDRLAQLEIDIQSMLGAVLYPRINISDTCKKRCSYFSHCHYSTEKQEIEEE